MSFHSQLLDHINQISVPNMSTVREKKQYKKTLNKRGETRSGRLTGQTQQGFLKK